MMTRSLLPLLAATFIATAGFSQNDDPAQLHRDLLTVMQQRDALIEQAAQARRESDGLKTSLEAARAEIAELRQKLALAGDPAAAAAATEQALREAELRADMAARGFALKEEETQRAAQSVAVAAQKQSAAEQQRDAALAEAARLSAELDALRQSSAGALAAKAQLQNDLYAAQVRIDNLARALAARGYSVPLPPPPQSPSPVAIEQSAPAAATEAQPAAAAETGPRTHTVADGETLSLLSFKYYGSPNKWDKIFNANRDKLKSPDHVRPGMVLKVP